MKPNLKAIISILIFTTITGCANRPVDDWRQEYLVQERSRIVTIQKSYGFVSGSYSLLSIDSTLVTFNDKGQKLGINDLHFYKYDKSGKIVAEEYCMRTCDKPGKEVYYYDSLNRLVKTVVKISEEKEWISGRYNYNDKNLLIKKVFGNDSTSTTEIYAYDILNRNVSIIKREYNTNVNAWLTYIDSMFYDTHNKIILRKRYRVGKDLLTISKYAYDDTLLISQIDTTFTKIRSYWPTPETSQHAYFFRIDYKYNDKNQIVEKITTRPDYKTPSYKVTYEYR